MLSAGLRAHSTTSHVLGSAPCHVSRRPRPLRSLRVTVQLQLFSLKTQYRTYATHKDTAAGSTALPRSSLLSQALDQKQRDARGQDRVGPFALGGVQPAFGTQEKVKKWDELSRRGQVARAAARTSNFAVILIGAGFTLALVYALTSELFARNSPTVLYKEACERIKASPKVAQYIQAPLLFHNHPPTHTRPKHRVRHVSSQLAVDSAGREHLLLNFYIRSKAKPSSAYAFFDDDDESSTAWIQRQWEDLSWEKTTEFSRAMSQKAMERCRDVFRFLTGKEEVEAAAAVDVNPETRTTIGQSEKEASSGGFWGFAGVFSGLGSKLSKARAEAGPSETWEEGEVHADLVKDEHGSFVWRYILIDFPNSAARNPTRVYVERTVDVAEGEAVMRWY